MSYAKIRKLLEVALNSLSVGVPTAWENTPFEPRVGVPWQQVSLLPAQTENPTMGDGFKREVGIFQIMAYYPVNQGAQAVYGRSDVLLAGFARGTVLYESPVRVLVDLHPYIGIGVPDGVWFRLPISVPYIADIQG